MHLLSNNFHKLSRRYPKYASLHKIMSSKKQIVKLFLKEIGITYLALVIFIQKKLTLHKCIIRKDLSNKNKL